MSSEILYGAFVDYGNGTTLYRDRLYTKSQTEAAKRGHTAARASSEISFFPINRDDFYQFLEAQKRAQVEGINRYRTTEPTVTKGIES